jgi:hypothetical protein
MDKDRLDANDFGNLQRSQNGVLEQAGTNAFALIGEIDGEAPQDDHRNGIRHIAPNWFGCMLTRDGAGCEAVIAHDGIAGTDDVGTCRVVRLTLERPRLKPFVEGRIFASERFEVVCRQTWSRGG